MSKFAVGDRIGLADDFTHNGELYYSQHDHPSYGVITDLLSDGRVMVKWDSDWRNKNNKSVDPQKLLLEDELQTKYSVLEEEFNKLQDEIIEKLKQAGDFVLDAQKIAKDAGFDLKELYDATYVLKNAMDKAGWNTSSWNC